VFIQELFAECVIEELILGEDVILEEGCFDGKITNPILALSFFLSVQIVWTTS
jgi:hypothetical protein